MSGITYREVFGRAFGSATHSPYPYQCRLACGSDAEPDDSSSLTTGTPCRSQLIEVPTGLGKTAGVVLAWLWNRYYQASEETRNTWPRRLIYCLPMRSLVDQTEKNVRDWLYRLDLLWDEKSDHAAKVGVHILMGGEESGQWDLYPEHGAILIGTQDMLLSRALNRGYGMSRYRWPMHFGLLNNDCLWVMDETQLMGVGIETSAQLRAFRERMGTVGSAPTWWMSATLDEVQLATVDHRDLLRETVRLKLSEKERALRSVSQRLKAVKRLHVAEQRLSSEKKDEVGRYTKAVADGIVQRHVAGTLTLAVFNRVSRAQAVYQAVCASRSNAKIAIIHSRFRAADRAANATILDETGDRIVIATQTVEAGIDISARTLFTEVAPWPSLVQRFGRCNRRGDEFPDGSDVYWLDSDPADPKDAAGLALPYLPEEMARSRKQLAVLSEVSLQTLENVEIGLARPIRPVLRRKDLLDLFDTTSDLAGNDLDISRLVRDGEDSDVQVFWRVVGERNVPSADTKLPHRDEICRVSATAFGEFLGRLRKAKEYTCAWHWNPLEEEWQPAMRAVPGRVYLLDCDAGGYDTGLGWTGRTGGHVPVVETSEETHNSREQSYDGVPREEIGAGPATLSTHTQAVVGELDGLLDGLKFASMPVDELRTAAWWHDVGKAHAEFQTALREHAPMAFPGEYLAKSGASGRLRIRPHFRHELASALAWLGSPEAAQHPPTVGDLIAYIIAAHHGKVRVSIRALPGEAGDPSNPERLFARGIWDGDVIPAPGETPIQFDGRSISAIPLDLSCMRLGENQGRSSWLARVLLLVNSAEIGPFRLAFHESVLRVADMRASRQPGSGVTAPHVH